MRGGGGRLRDGSILNKGKELVYEVCLCTKVRRATSALLCLIVKPVEALYFEGVSVKRSVYAAIVASLRDKCSRKPDRKLARVCECVGS